MSAVATDLVGPFLDAAAAVAIAATFNPVTYIMEALRSLILDDLAWAKIGRGFAVVAVGGVLMVFLNVRAIRSYD